MAQVQVPATAIAAFYFTDTGDLVDSEFLFDAQLPRDIRGAIWNLGPAQRPMPPVDPVLMNQQSPMHRIGNGADVCLYVDLDDRVVAFESNVPNNREIRSLLQEAGAGPCAARCQIRGPNGTYCMPGCV